MKKKPLPFPAAPPQLPSIDRRLQEDGKLGAIQTVTLRVGNQCFAFRIQVDVQEVIVTTGTLLPFPAPKASGS
jgi:hypothetical protein